MLSQVSYGIAFLTGMTYCSIVSTVLAQSLVGLYIAANYETIFHANIPIRLRRILFVTAPLVPCLANTKLLILQYQADRALKHWVDGEADLANYIKKKDKMVKLRQTCVTVKQIVSNLEDIPQIIVMISFIIVSITLVNQDILPNQLQLDFKRMHAFYLTLYSPSTLCCPPL